MNKKYISQNIQEIIDDLNSKNFEKVIKKIELLSEKKTDVNFEFWKEQIEIYEKSFLKKIDKFKLFINIGVIFFTPKPLPNILVACINTGNDVFSIDVFILVYTLFAIFSLKF